MSLNWVEIDKILEELPLEGCFLQNIRQTSYHHLVFELHRPGRTIHLLICLERSALRIHETEQHVPSLPRPPRFASLLRSRVKGCRIEKVTQLGQERIIRMELRKGELPFRLYIRLWGGAANLFLCDAEGKILDAFSRRPARGEVPGEYYVPEKMEIHPSKRIFTLKEDLLLSGKSYNQSLDNYYASLEASSDLDHLRKEARKTLEILENQYRSGLTGLKKRLAEYEKEGELRQMGDRLMGVLGDLKKGDREYIPEDGTSPIPLDPRKSPVENAQEYYKKAGKASRGREMTEEDLGILEQKLIRVEEKRQRINQEEDPDYFKNLFPAEAVRKSLQKEKTTPGLTFYSGDFTLLTGRNSTENDELLRNHVRGNDYWLHTRDYPGGYVFIRSRGKKSVPLEVLLDAGNLALFYSKAKKTGQADVYYTQVKYLRRPKEGKKGLVLPTKEKNLYIKLDEKRINRLKSE